MVFFINCGLKLSKDKMNSIFIVLKILIMKIIDMPSKIIFNNFRRLFFMIINQNISMLKVLNYLNNKLILQFIYKIIKF
jgi:hypothetical protein